MPAMKSAKIVPAPCASSCRTERIPRTLFFRPYSGATWPVDRNLMLDRLTDNLEIRRNATGEPSRGKNKKSAGACGAKRERTMAAETIGFVGTGRMGGPMAGRLVDAPVSGGIKGAVNGTLAVMVSCPKATYDRVEPILKHFGKLFYTGDKPGTAQTAKLANNLMAAAALVITSEAVAMGVKGGVNAKVLIDIINASSGRNSASEDKFPRAVLPGTFDFGFTTGLSYKDVRLCVDEAEAMGVPMVCGSVVRQMLAITNAKYGASSDFTSIAKVLEEWAGVEMRG